MNIKETEMAKKEGPLLKGRLRLTQDMVGANWRGLQTFRNKRFHHKWGSSHASVLIKSAYSELSRCWYYALTPQQRDEWEFYAKGLTCVAEEVSSRIASGAKNIIPKRRKLMSGFNAFLGSNIAAFTRGLSYPRYNAPISTPAPCPPTNITVTTNNGIAKVKWTDPHTSQFSPDAKIILAIYVQVQIKTLIPTQLAGIIKVPSPGEFNIEFVRCSSMYGPVTIPLKKLIYSELRVQMDTLVSEGENTGAILSSPSNVATTIIERVKTIMI